MEIKEAETRKTIKKKSMKLKVGSLIEKNRQTFSQNDQEIREKTQLTKLRNKRGMSLLTSQK